MKGIDRVIAHYRRIGIALSPERAEAIVRAAGDADGDAYLAATRQLVADLDANATATPPPAGSKFADSASVGYPTA